MEVTVRQLKGVEFAIQSRAHTILCDQPAENGGEDSGMTPPELMLASLGSCAAFYAVQYLKSRKLAEGGVEVSVTAEKLMQPTRLGNFRVQVTCPVPLTKDQTDALCASLPDPQHAADAA
jgi:putative redox protein